MQGPSHRHVNAARPQANRRSMPAGGTAPARDGADFPIVGIGASAGGLEACRHLLDALPAGNGMAFILVQHLDPNHESMMVDLLAGQTSMTVCQVTDGMPVERDHLYVIPPGAYLSAGSGVLHLTEPQARHGARLPFDFLLNSLADEYGERAICVILSGTGADGSLGLKAVKSKGGYIIAQSPDEAAYDGMPRSAIATGMVDRVLTVAQIPETLAEWEERQPSRRAETGTYRKAEARNCLPEIIELLRTRTAHDFTLYKPGTLQRRIAQRMAMAAIEADGTGRYLEILRNDADELDLLAKDLLINVTSFFRDPKVFEFLTDKVISRPGPGSSGGSAAAHMDRRLQHRRGSLFHRDAFLRRDRGRETRHQASGLRVRCRSRRRGDRARGPVSGYHRSGCIRGPARTLLPERRARLQSVRRVARFCRLHGPGYPGRPPVFAPRHGFMQEPDDLPGFRGPGAGGFHFPFRPA